MLRKLMKYNLKFGKNTFLGMAAVMVLASIFLRIIASNVLHSMDIMALIALVMMPVAVVCVVLVFQNFSRSLYGNEGYFTQTLPAKKSSIVLAQLLTALIWFLFMIFMAGVSISILAGFEVLKMVFAEIFTLNNILFLLFILIGLVLYASYMILVVFMGITTANVSVSGKRIHGGLAAIGVFAYLTLGSFIENLIGNVLGEKVLHLVYNGDKFFLTMNYTGMDMSTISIDLVSFIWTIALSLGAYFITVYLLNKRVDLK